jgi:hypothetical protein
MFFNFRRIPTNSTDCGSAADYADSTHSSPIWQQWLWMSDSFVELLFRVRNCVEFNVGNLCFGSEARFCYSGFAKFENNCKVHMDG